MEEIHWLFLTVILICWQKLLCLFQNLSFLYPQFFTLHVFVFLGEGLLTSQQAATIFGTPSQGNKDVDLL